MMTGNISTVELIWGSVWRASLYGVLLGAGFGGLYAAALGTIFVFPTLGTVLGFFFGAYVGALLGFPLGLLAGLLLFTERRRRGILRGSSGGSMLVVEDIGPVLEKLQYR